MRAFTPAKHTNLPHNGAQKWQTVISLTLFQRRDLTGMLLCARTLINLQQEAADYICFPSGSLRNLKNGGKLKPVQIGKHFPEHPKRGPEGKIWKAHKALGGLWTLTDKGASNSWKLPHFWSFAMPRTGAFGAALQLPLKIPTAHSTAFKMNWKWC